MQEAAEAPRQRQGDTLELTCNGMVSHRSLVKCVCFSFGCSKSMLTLLCLHVSEYLQVIRLTP